MRAYVLGGGLSALDVVRFFTSRLGETPPVYLGVQRAFAMLIALQRPHRLRIRFRRRHRHHFARLDGVLATTFLIGFLGAPYLLASPFVLFYL